ncbi:phosphoribosyltransferase family protein [Actinomadura parmotrematis]|uniref:Phosphoribosyltransferase family protein n=1 Tax=Actinomadura parmotrematis TaxID=2864039 RepID=A0ABS7FTE1_9ACTN|nr:phosphoribosyltransferase family protein [Actinomadura parmotrematis]MBW8483475.1 phosphoribosyltransferase family protein [Actinomadura parmotrematis]
MRRGGTWPGEWVSARLGVRVTGDGVDDLVGLAVRRNPRRAHLLVSGVLGKHVPTEPRLVYGAGLLLGEAVRLRLRGRDTGAEQYLPFLANALRGTRGAAGALRDRLREPKGGVDAVVLGYAETATALGHAVADALGDAYYLHSTRRRPGAGRDVYGGFEEEHSHATGHLLAPADRAAFDRDVPVVLVDDELSTGRTVLNTVRALHAARPRSRYVLAALVDMRSEADRMRLRDLAAELGARIDAVSLAAGRVELPVGLAESARRLVDELASGPPEVVPAGVFATERVDLGWPAGVPAGGRHGFVRDDRLRLEKELPEMARRVAAQLPPGAGRVLVLGTEELMYAPLRLAAALADLLPAADVRFSTTTRSPALAVDDPGYALRTRLVFPAHDDPADGPGERYAYNVDDSFDAIVLVTDAAGDTPELAAGLLPLLAGRAPVLLAVIPEEGA